ncbi:MAG: hypothetical protein ACO3O0_10590, partial [Bacteroidia bacterium]
RILKLEKKSKASLKAAALGSMVNEPPVHNANAAFSPDHKWVVFTKCKNDYSTGKLICQLYYSRLTNGKWSKPEQVKQYKPMVPPDTYYTSPPTVLVV